MKSYKDLNTEFERKVEKLRNECKHEKLSGWLIEEYAPMHFTGYLVKICEFCYKEIKRRKCKDINKYFDRLIKKRLNINIIKVDYGTKN